MQTSLNIVRPGGAIGRVGVPHGVTIPADTPTFFSNITVSGGPAPARAYFEELMAEVLDGRIDPGRVFDWVGSLDQVPDGYRAMDSRTAIKALIEF
jgi:threonine dehydrogenase-like Zn-dependent dehydrogenase